MLFKEIVDGRTHGRTDDGQRTPDIEGSQKLTEHFVLRWAKKISYQRCIISSHGYTCNLFKYIFPELNKTIFEQKTKYIANIFTGPV